jgi:hypothetical protein
VPSSCTADLPWCAAPERQVPATSHPTVCQRPVTHTHREGTRPCTHTSTCFDSSGMPAQTTCAGSLDTPATVGHDTVAVKRPCATHHRRSVVLANLGGLSIIPESGRPLELPRFDGHLMIAPSGVKGVRYEYEEPAEVHAGVQGRGRGDGRGRRGQHRPGRQGTRGLRLDAGELGSPGPRRGERCPDGRGASRDP